MFGKLSENRVQLIWQRLATNSIRFFHFRFASSEPFLRMSAILVDVFVFYSIISGIFFRFYLKTVSLECWHQQYLLYRQYLDTIYSIETNAHYCFICKATVGFCFHLTHVNKLICFSQCTFYALILTVFQTGDYVFVDHALFSI